MVKTYKKRVSAKVIITKDIVFPLFWGKNYP